MKELEKFNQDIQRRQVELEQQQKQQQEFKFEFSQKPLKGHILFEIHLKSLKIKPAEFTASKTINWEDAVKGVATNTKEVVRRRGCVYISALNKRNALKRLEENKGSALLPEPIFDLNNPYQ